MTGTCFSTLTINRKLINLVPDVIMQNNMIISYYKLIAIVTREKYWPILFESTHNGILTAHVARICTAYRPVNIVI